MRLPPVFGDERGVIGLGASLSPVVALTGNDHGLVLASPVEHRIGKHL